MTYNMFCPRYFAITYGVSFAVLTAAVVTVFLWHYDDIISAFSSRHAAEKSPPDVHVQMMEASYDPVPASWYAAIGISMLLAAMYVVTFYPMQLPIWALFLSLLVALVFLPACGIIAATTGTVIGEASIYTGVVGCDRR
jgi:predicted PurR-regulated permease PerM